MPSTLTLLTELLRRSSRRLATQFPTSTLWRRSLGETQACQSLCELRTLFLYSRSKKRRRFLLIRAQPYRAQLFCLCVGPRVSAWSAGNAATTPFPSGVGQGSTFNESLVFNIAATTAVQVRAAFNIASTRKHYQRHRLLWSDYQRGTRQPLGPH